MAESRRPVGRLQIDADYEFHRRMLTIQHVCWGAMVVVIAAALLGLFGNGPLSRPTITVDGSPARLEYPRFARLGASQTLRARVVVEGNSARLRISREYLRNVQVQRITPMPVRAEARADGVEFLFQVHPSARAAEVLIDLKPRRAGTLSGGVVLGDGVPRDFNQFIYP